MTDRKDPDGKESAYTVPDDFPRERIAGALPGAQPKYLAALYKGRYYLSGCTPPELYDRWCVCEDLAAQLSVKSLASKAGKRSDLSESEILHQYYTRLIETRWTSLDEARWIIQKVAQKIGWNDVRYAWLSEE